MARAERGGYSDRRQARAGAGAMKDLPDSRHRGSVSARYRLGGIGGKDVRDRGFESGFKNGISGSWMYEYSPTRKFEWECLIDKRRNGDEHRSPRNRFQEFKGREDVFHENMSLEMERERELRLLHSCHDVGQRVSPHLVDRRSLIPAKNGYPGLYDTGKMEGEGQQEEELLRRGKYSHEEGKYSFHSDKGPGHMAPSPAQYRFSRHPSSGNLSEAGEKTRAGKAELGSFFHEDIGPGFQSDYAPLSKTAEYQPQSKTPSPLSISKPSDYGEGNSEYRRCFVGEDGDRISYVNGHRGMILPPYFSRSNAATPLSTGYGSEEEEFALIRESPATENIASRKYFHRDDGTRNYSDYVHSYMMPSTQSKSKTLTSQSMVCASRDREQTFMSNQSVAKRYFTEEDAPSYNIDGLPHVMPSPSKLDLETIPSMSVSHASDLVAKSTTRLLPKPQQCLRSRTPLLPSYSSLPNTEFSHESSLRLNELHSNGLDQDACGFHCRKEEYSTRDQNCAYSEEDVRSRYNRSCSELHGKLSSTSEDYGHGDRLWVHVMNGEDACGHSHGPNLKSSMSLQHHQSSEEQDFLIHPHDSGAHHQNRDIEVLHHNILRHDVKTKAHYHEDRKLNQLDNDPDAYFMDGDNPGYFHSSSCCDGSLHGNRRALLRGRHGRNNSFTFNKPYIKHQEHKLNHLEEKDDDELEHLSSGDMQCQMLMRRSAHIQNKDFTGVGDEALDNTIDFECRSPFKKLPLRMQKRLGNPNNSAVWDIKKRLRQGPQSKDSQLFKKHKSSSPPTGMHDTQEHHSSDPSASKATSEIAELDEHSKKFKELVNRAFLESVKHLFESSAQQRKYMGLDKCGSLRCAICGSSREFKDAHSLANHAFGYIKIGLRAQHLGLHKALCVLMGWNSIVAPNNSVNLADLSESEHLAVKEDLIIWPPVVIVHNSSVSNKDLRKQKIISIGKLESILEGAGFSGNNHKVHLGNDEGIMVLRFSATLSGLQAAQELHKFYVKNKHGRDELQHLTLNEESGSHEESEKAILKAEDILYGYLGIVEDLSKLDSQIKKWSLIKSKKELLATAP